MVFLFGMIISQEENIKKKDDMEDRIKKQY